MNVHSTFMHYSQKLEAAQVAFSRMGILQGSAARQDGQLLVPARLAAARKRGLLEPSHKGVNILWPHLCEILEQGKLIPGGKKPQNIGSLWGAGETRKECEKQGWQSHPIFTGRRVTQACAFVETWECTLKICAFQCVNLICSLH